MALVTRRGFTLNLNSPSVFEEAAHPGEGSRGSEVGHQTLLPAQRHQQGRVQGHPEKSCAQGKHSFSP